MTIATHHRTKVEIIIDRPHLRRMTDVLDRHRVPGYSVFSSLEGKGSRGAWHKARLTDADDRALIVAVTSDETANAILSELAELFEEIPGVVFASDVRVIRSERF